MPESTEVQFVERIQSAYPKMSPAQTRVAEYILAHPEEAAILSSTKIAKKVSVSQSTVVRLIYSLGYKSFKDLQLAIQAQVALRLNSVARMHFSMAQAQEQMPLLYKTMRGDIESIARTMQLLSVELLDRVIDEILDARRVYVLGYGVSNVAAVFLGIGLRRVLFETVVLANMNDDIAEHMLGIRPRDVLVAYSYARYSRKTLRCAEFARQAGARVIAITDSPISPLAQLAHTVVVTTPLPAWYLGAPVAQVSVAGAILAGLVTRRRAAAEVRLRHTETALDFFHTYTWSKTNGGFEEASQSRGADNAEEGGELRGQTKDRRRRTTGSVVFRGKVATD